jgi:hypothetical protein
LVKSFANSLFVSIKSIPNTDVTTGIDGYLYYTGLLRRVQRIVDGYEPEVNPNKLPIVVVNTFVVGI